MVAPQESASPQFSSLTFTERTHQLILFFPKRRLDIYTTSRKTITATASSKYKLDWLQSIQNGATHVVNYKTHDFAAEVKKTTGGKGVDVIIDIVGQSHFVKNIDALAVDGRMTMLGLLSGGSCVLF